MDFQIRLAELNPMNCIQHLASRIFRNATRLHRDERGTMSIVSVFTLILLVMLLGMVVNSTRQVARKVQMQNAADAATYTGGVVLARGMNTLAFTNHLLSDVIAVTAFMREARDRHSESFTPETLEHWARIAPHLASSEFPRFAALGAAIPEKLPLEGDLIRTYSDLHEAISSQMLPVLEEVLAYELIPEFQRALVMHTPRIAQLATNEVARRHGAAWPDPAQLHGVLWRTIADPVGGVSEADRRTMPVVDPVMDSVPNQRDYVDNARKQRRSMATRYLNDWNHEKLYYFDNYGKMSQFSNIWRIFTCGHLEQLLEVEYPYRNLPMQIREVPGEYDNPNVTLEQDYQFVGVVYEEGIDEQMPGIYDNPIEFDKQAYAQVSMFVPTRRLEMAGGDVLREDWDFWIDNQGIVHWYNAGATSGGGISWRSTHRNRGGWGRHPIEWGLITQNWTTQLTPAATQSLLTILSSDPMLDGVELDLPEFTNTTPGDIPWLSHH